MGLSRKRLAVAAIAGTICLVGSVSAHAIESISVEWATGNKTRMLRLGVQSYWETEWLKTGGTHLTGYWDFTVAQWQGRQYRNVPDSRKDLLDVGITPVLRFEKNDRSGFYGEAGLGVHALSRLYNNNGRRLSTHLQFGSHLGIGYYFSQNVDITLKCQHFSNGSIKRPNSGVDFVVARLAYRF